jgi:hypothetical protein
MGEPPKAELLRSLGRVVRGLSALFWGAPVVALVYLQTATTDWLEFFGVMSPRYFGALGVLPGLVTSLILFYGLMQLRHFQKQERIWQNALGKAELFALLNTGLCPFLFWWHRFPDVPLYGICVSLLIISSLVLLILLNHVLHRLTAMVPDDMLRSETFMFTSFNALVLNIVLICYGIYLILGQIPHMPVFMFRLLTVIRSEGIWVATFLILMPLAMTMYSIWKIKEVIFSSVFDAER